MNAPVDVVVDGARCSVVRTRWALVGASGVGRSRDGREVQDLRIEDGDAVGER